MLKPLLFITLLLAPVFLQAQTKTVNIGTSVGMWDSTFVIQSGTTDSFYVGNHPQAGAYSNAKIFICQNATLKYNYQFGTSSNPNFYLASGANLKVYGSFNAQKVFMQPNSTIECIGGNFTAEQLHRQNPVTLLSVGSMFYDSVYTAVNYTFTSWPGGVSPCAAVTANSNVQIKESAILVYPNPVTNILNIANVPDNATVNIYDILGRNINISKIFTNNNVQINCTNLPNGNYYIVLNTNNGTEIKTASFTKQ